MPAKKPSGYQAEALGLVKACAGGATIKGAARQLLAAEAKSHRQATISPQIFGFLLEAAKGRESAAAAKKLLK